jgi:hypothetical protein
MSFGSMTSEYVNKSTSKLVLSVKDLCCFDVALVLPVLLNVITYKDDVYIRRSWAQHLHGHRALLIAWDALRFYGSLQRYGSYSYLCGPLQRIL